MYRQNPISRREAIGALGVNAKLPRTGAGPVEIKGFKIQLLPQIPRIKDIHRYPKPHRIVVHCPCGRLIPLGRLAQHIDSRTHFEELLENRVIRTRKGGRFTMEDAFEAANELRCEGPDAVEKAIEEGELPSPDDFRRPNECRICSEIVVPPHHNGLCSNECEEKFNDPTRGWNFDYTLYARCREILDNARRDLGFDLSGFGIIDLLADNTELSIDQCYRIRERLVREDSVCQHCRTTVTSGFDLVPVDHELRFTISDRPHSFVCMRCANPTNPSGR